MADEKPHTLVISGWPRALPPKEIKILTETVGEVVFFEMVEEEGARANGACKVRYATEDMTTKAIKGFNGLEMGDVVLTVTEEGGKREEGRRRRFSSRSRSRDRNGDRERSSRRDGPSRSGSREDRRRRKPSRERSRRSRSPGHPAGGPSDAPAGGRKKSRFAPPPAGTREVAGLLAAGTFPPGLASLPPAVAAGLAAQGITTVPGGPPPPPGLPPGLGGGVAAAASVAANLNNPAMKTQVRRIRERVEWLHVCAHVVLVKVDGIIVVHDGVWN